MELNPKAKYFHIDRVLGELYYNASWNPDLSNRKYVYTTSSSAAFKGGVSLVRAFGKLKEKGRKDIQLRMAGIHPRSRVGKTIQRLINQNDMHKQVELLGRIPPEQVKAELEQASLFVLPSHMDNSPNSLAEAMMVGVPCIASDAGGIPSMLKHEVEGLIYPHQSTAGLAKNIEKLIDDRELALNFGQNARQTAMKRHDPKRITQLTIDMYDWVLSEN
jgi:glycosyltransferase involved in cell wall biosynthesis